MLPCTISYFGYLKGGYTQFPDDYAKKIYIRFKYRSTAQSQIIIHRNGDLMYYGYIRKLKSKQQYIGICILLNGIMFSKIEPLFPIFENAVAVLALKRDILKLDYQGDIYANTTDLSFFPHELGRTTSIIAFDLSKIEQYTTKLPAVNFAISKNSEKIFSSKDLNEDIVAASCNYAYTFVLKDSVPDTVALANYKGTVRKLYAENESIFQEYTALKINYDNLKKQKKQYAPIGVLVLCLAASIIGLCFISLQLDNSKRALEATQIELSQKNDKIYDLQQDLTDLKQKYTSLEDTIASIQPLIIQKTAFNFNTGEFSFSYYGLCEKKITFSVKAYCEDEIFYTDYQMEVKKGMNKSSVYISNNLSNSRWYSFEILIGNRIIGGGRH